MLLKVSPDFTLYVPPVELLLDELVALEEVFRVLLELEEVAELLDELLSEFETFKF